MGGWFWMKKKKWRINVFSGGPPPPPPPPSLGTSGRVPPCPPPLWYTLQSLLAYYLLLIGKVVAGHHPLESIVMCFKNITMLKESSKNNTANSISSVTISNNHVWFKAHLIHFFHFNTSSAPSPLKSSIELFLGFFYFYKKSIFCWWSMIFIK